MIQSCDPTTTVPLLLHWNSLRFRATPIVHHVSPVMEDDMPLRLSSRSPLKLLGRRLDELALPKQGTKLDKWTRLQKREKELDRKDVVEKLQSRYRTPVRRTRRRKVTSSRKCFHSRGTSSASRERGTENLRSNVRNLHSLSSHSVPVSSSSPV